MSEEQETPKIHVDSDWKAQAQEEKRKMADQAKAKQQEAKQEQQPAQAQAGDDSSQEQQSSQSGQQGMPPANFETLLSTMATQALFAMGAIADPRTGKATLQLDLAKHHIDMLGVIEEKTKGNLSEQESKLLSGTLQELRNHFVQAAQAAKKQQAKADTGEKE